jgi:hypothetical protein
MEDQKYAGRVMSNLRRSSDDMREVLDKINSRQGSERERMGCLAVQGCLQRVASVQHHGLAELRATADRAVEL